MRHQKPAQRTDRISNEPPTLVEDADAHFEAERTAFQLETAMELVDLSERYGNLKERMSILMLADAWFRAREYIGDFSET